MTREILYQGHSKEIDVPQQRGRMRTNHLPSKGRRSRQLSKMQRPFYRELLEFLKSHFVITLKVNTFSFEINHDDALLGGDQRFGCSDLLFQPCSL